MSVAAELSELAARQLSEAQALLDGRDLRAALAAFDRAESMDADADLCSGGRWLALMLQGNFAGAWQESDAIRRRGGPDPHRFWMGEEVRGKRVILRCLHGFGDAIQFLRYLPALRALAKQVIVEVPPRMLELAPFLAGAEEVIPWGADAPSPSPEWDVQIEVMELPYLFRTTVGDLPIAVHYLRLPNSDVDRAERSMGPRTRGLRVGLVWSAGEWNEQRSLPMGMVERLLPIAGVEFWSLQGASAASQARPLIDVGAMHDAAVCGDGQRVLAAVIANLDLVITVDTLAAHLAGAMQVPVWLLLQHAADWRWMTDRSDTPWYPTMRLFRQPSTAVWDRVIETVRAELLALVEAKSQGVGELRGAVQIRGAFEP